MSNLQKMTDIDRLADKRGLAISVVNESRRELYTSNNNSICAILNPGPGFSKDCDRYCGEAFQRAESAKNVIKYRCHAGLDCRAVSFQSGQSSLAVIVGRTFVDTRSYKKAADRAVSGDWAGLPDELFENVLISGSAQHLDDTVEDVLKLVSDRSDDTFSSTVSEPSGPIAAPDDRVSPQPSAIATQGAKNRQSTARNQANGISDWRSFFGTLLESDYEDAAAATLEFVVRHFGLRSAVWLKREGDNLESSIALGKAKDRRIRIAIAAEDRKLLDALANGKSLVFDERTKIPGNDHERKVTLFPIGMHDGVSGAIAVLNGIHNTSSHDKIVRLCRSIAPQFEILRLRSEVARGESLSAAVKRFGVALKRFENENLWVTMTQNAAEILRAERSSLLIFDQESGRFEAKAFLGAELNFGPNEPIGNRIAKYVFESKRAIAVENIFKTGITMDSQSDRYKTPSFMSSPLSVAGRVIGVMNFADRAGGEHFDKAALDIFEAIAPQIALAIDRADLQRKAGEFEQLSVTDALTGLLNRRYIEERLMEETKRSNRHGYPMSFMMVDVDEFKSYNDSFGHPAGDTALKMVGSVIRDTLRSADVAARFGGEEFAILLPQTTGREGRTIAERIRANVEHTTFPHRPVTISIGISTCSAELCRDADLVSAADQALYKAKRSGRNRVLAFNDNPNPVGQER